MLGEIGDIPLLARTGAKAVVARLVAFGSVEDLVEVVKDLLAPTVGEVEAVLNDEAQAFAVVVLLLWRSIALANVVEEGTRV